MAVTWVHTDSFTQSNSTSATLDVGTATSDRTLMVFVMADIDDAINTMTIGGVVPYVSRVQNSTDGMSIHTCYGKIWSTGTSLSWSAPVNLGQTRFEVYAVYGANTTVADQYTQPWNSGYSDPGTASNLDLPVGGLGIGAYINSGTGVISWTDDDNWTERSDIAITGARCSTATYEVSGTTTVTANGSGSQGGMSVWTYSPSALNISKFSGVPSEDIDYMVHQGTQLEDIAKINGITLRG
jgi:hypothetical protein